VSGRILAVDPGDRRIGIAISDPSGTIANPFGVIIHEARLVDAAQIAQIAREQAAEKIVVGCPYDSDGQVGPQARKAVRMADAIRSQTDLEVILWDEAGSTQEAQAARIALGANRARRAGHLDDLAATYILQTYLDSLRSPHGT
jgi:putative holliday junction resolvase